MADRNRHTYTDADLIEAVKTSTSFRQVLLKLGVRAQGGNYASVKNKIRRLGEACDTSHLVSYRTGGFFGGTPKTLSEVLVNGENYVSSAKLKRRLISGGHLENCCGNPACSISTWHGVFLVLHLDHINGINTDNRLENLRLLCPNCHSQTPTYCRGVRKAKSPYVNSCVTCSAPILSRSTVCPKCAQIATGLGNQKIEWPPVEELVRDVQETSFLAVAKRLGVSDNAIRRHLGRQGVVVRKNSQYRRKSL